MGDGSFSRGNLCQLLAAFRPLLRAGTRTQRTARDRGGGMARSGQPRHPSRNRSPRRKPSFSGLHPCLSRTSSNCRLCRAKKLSRVRRRIVPRLHRSRRSCRFLVSRKHPPLVHSLAANCENSAQLPRRRRQRFPTVLLSGALLRLRKPLPRKLLPHSPTAQPRSLSVQRHQPLPRFLALHLLKWRSTKSRPCPR